MHVSTTCFIFHAAYFILHVHVPTITCLLPTRHETGSKILELIIPDLDIWLIKFAYSTSHSLAHCQVAMVIRVEHFKPIPLLGVYIEGQS